MKKSKNKEPGIGTKIFMCILLLVFGIYILVTQQDFVFLQVVPLPFWLVGGLLLLMSISLAVDSWKTLKK